MSATSPAAPGRSGSGSGSTAASGSDAWSRFFEIVLGIAGAIALFLGIFVQFAGEDQSIGFFGVWSTRVEDVSEAWKFALLTGGSLLLGLAFGLAALRRSRARAATSLASRVYAILAMVGFVAAVVFAVLWAL